MGYLAALDEERAEEQERTWTYEGETYRATVKQAWSIAGFLAAQVANFSALTFKKRDWKSSDFIRTDGEGKPKSKQAIADKVLAAMSMVGRRE